MLSITGTTNYSTANIEGRTFTDTSADVEQLKFDTQAITYNDITDTTNIDGNLTIPNGVLSIPNFANVGNTLSDFSNRLQGISYSSAGDITTIDNSVRVNKDFTVKGYFNIDQIYSSAILTLDTDGGIDIIGGGVKASGDIIQSTGIITQSGSGTNAMKAITLNTNNNLTTSGTGIISQSGTGMNTLKNTNIVGDLTTTTFKTERALLGYQTDEFINKDPELRLYLPFDTILGSGFRFYNFNKYFVDGTYTATSVSQSGTITNSNQVGQVGNTSFEYTNGRYFWNYTGTTYDCNYLSFGGWVKAFTSTTSSRLFFINVGAGGFLILDVAGGTMSFLTDSYYFQNVSSVATGTNNLWVHIFVVIDGTTQKVYRNGTLINTTTRILYTANSEATFGIGRTSLVGTSNVDDLRIYSRALNDAEVASVYAYRGSLTEPYPIKMNGLVMIGDRIDQNNATRAVNIRDTNGIISIARYVGGQAGFELLTYGQATGTRTSNVLCLGGNDSGDAFNILFRQNGIDNFVFTLTSALCTINAAMRVQGSYLRIDGGITQETSTSTNQMRAITLYDDQNLTQSGTGIITQSGTGTNALKNTSITGTLAITGYSDVKATLDTFSTTSTAITGISYNSSTDTTTIDNNVKINKNLKLEDNTVVLTGPTGYVMDECEKHTFLYSVNRPIGAPFRTIRTTSFDALNINADFNTPSGRYTFQLVKIFKGVTYTGAFMINSSAGSNGHPAQMALMEAGIGKVSVPLLRLAVTDTFTTNNSTLHYAPFRTPYTATETREAYIGYVITAIALNPVVRGAAISYNNNYKITTCQTGSLTSLCCGYSGSTSSSFDTMGTSLNPSQAMTAFSTQMYCGLYTDQ